MSVAKFTKELPWKEFNVNLELAKTAIEAVAGEHFCGTSADSNFKLHFLEVPSQVEQDAIDAYWDALTDQSPEAAYVSQQQVKDAIQAAREGIPASTWGNLTVAQKKLLAGLTPTAEDLGL